MRLALQIRRKAVGTLLSAKKSITDLQLKSESDFGQQQHVRSREYRLDTLWTMFILLLLPYRSMGSVDSDVKYSKTFSTDKEVLYCTSCCKPVSVQSILDTKVIFEGGVTDMRKSLDELDRCPHGVVEPSVGDTDSTDPTNSTQTLGKGGSSNDDSHCTDEDTDDEYMDSDDESESDTSDEEDGYRPVRASTGVSS